MKQALFLASIGDAEFTGVGFVNEVGEERGKKGLGSLVLNVDGVNGKGGQGVRYGAREASIGLVEGMGAKTFVGDHELHTLLLTVTDQGFEQVANG